MISGNDLKDTMSSFFVSITWIYNSYIHFYMKHMWHVIVDYGVVKVIFYSETIFTSEFQCKRGHDFVNVYFMCLEGMMICTFISPYCYQFPIYKYQAIISQHMNRRMMKRLLKWNHAWYTFICSGICV